MLKVQALDEMAHRSSSVLSLLHEAGGLMGKVRHGICQGNAEEEGKTAKGQGADQEDDTRRHPTSKATSLECSHGRRQEDSDERRNEDIEDDGAKDPDQDDAETRQDHDQDRRQNGRQWHVVGSCRRRDATCQRVGILHPRTVLALRRGLVGHH